MVSIKTKRLRPGTILSVLIMITAFISVFVNSSIVFAEIQDFAINKVDQDGRDLDGANFMVYETSYTLRNMFFPGKTGVYITSDGVYLIPFLAPFSLLGDGVYSVMLQTENTITLLDGREIDMQQFFANHSIPIPSFEGAGIFCEVVKDETGEQCDLYDIANGRSPSIFDPDPNAAPTEIPEIFDWQKIIKNVYLVPISLASDNISVEKIDQILSEATLLSKDQYAISEQGILKDKSAIKITIPVAEIKNAKSQELLPYHTFATMEELLGTHLGGDITEYGNHAGGITVKEIGAPEGYELANPIQQSLNIYNTNQATFVNIKKTEADPEEPSEEDILVPNTGGYTKQTNSTAISLSVAIPITCILLCNTVMRLKNKKVDFKK